MVPIRVTITEAVAIRIAMVALVLARSAAAACRRINSISSALAVSSRSLAPRSFPASHVDARCTNAGDILPCSESDLTVATNDLYEWFGTYNSIPEHDTVTIQRLGPNGTYGWVAKFFCSNVIRNRLRDAQSPRKIIWWRRVEVAGRL
jgi:hypothetical protein